MDGSPAPGKRPPPEDGYELWLRYRKVDSDAQRSEYRSAFSRVFVAGASETMRAARRELELGLETLLDAPVTFTEKASEASLIVGRESPVVDGSPATAPPFMPEDPDGFLIHIVNGRRSHVSGSSDVGALYGVFHLLRGLQLGQPLQQLSTSQAPKVRLRMLDHWDNLNGTIERGYAGFSIWNWHLLPGFLSPRYRDYARAMASVGLNAAALTNVNADSRVLRPVFLDKVAALANVFRPYGIRVFLTARFSAPLELGGLSTADPRVASVKQFWRHKAREIYTRIPDFGGFLIKANSEGQPGPQDYQRSHAEGANVLAEALAPFGGSVIWRAFVYDDKVPDDRTKQAYDEFLPLDGQFLPNVMLQVKNGPLDFQPREPFHPLFGALTKTPTLMEFQLTQEYLGFASHLVYLAPLFKEVLDAETHTEGPGSTVACAIDGSLTGIEATGMAAVSNLGSDRNWCGHPFAQANWYAFGRLAWDHSLDAATVADEWLRLTFSLDERFLSRAKNMMLGSHEVCVDTMTPLGLHHLMAESHHYGPGPWVDGGRPDWTSVYYHRADEHGLGFDRGASGSNALAQYAATLAETWGDSARCPVELLLWFHHIGWDDPIATGRTLWEELCFRYQRGVEGARALCDEWLELDTFVDAERFEHVKSLLSIQVEEAVWWRDACLSYFQTLSKRPIPDGVEPPAHPLAHYKARQPYPVPGAPWLK